MEVVADKKSCQPLDRLGTFVEGIQSCGEYERAVVDCDKAIKLDLNNMGASLDPTLAHCRVHQHEVTIAVYDKASALSPGNAAICCYRWNLYREPGEYARAPVTREVPWYLCQPLVDLARGKAG